MENKAKTTTLSEQFQKLPHCRNSSKNYHMVGTVPTTTTLSEQQQSKNYHTVETATKQKLPHCRNSSKIKQKKQKLPQCRTVPKSYRKIMERGQIDTYSTQIQDLTWYTHRPSWHELITPFLFTNLFSIKFLYFFIISSRFPYFNLFVSIFIQSYVNIKLHVSTLYRYMYQ